MRSMRRHSLWLVALLLSAAIALPASGQGLNGLLPDPISALRLGEYGDILELSSAQRLAVQAMHARYREEFRVLREGPIAAWHLGSIRRTMSPRSFYTDSRDLVQRIATIDNSLFDQMQTVLTDEQIARLVRVRELRERDRLAHGQYALWGALQPFDLSSAVLDLALPPEVMTAVEPILAAYEPALTARLEAYVEAEHAHMMRQYDVLAELGFTDARITDPDNRAAVAEAWQQAVQPLAIEEAPRRYERAEHIHDLNRKTLAALLAVVPEEEGRWLQNAFWRATYPQLRSAIRDGTPFDDALRRTDLTDDQRATLVAEATKWRAEMRDRLRPLMERMDAFRAKFESGGPMANWTDYGKEQQAITEQSRRIWDDTTESWDAGRARASAIVGDINSAEDDLSFNALVGFPGDQKMLIGVRRVAVLMPAVISPREEREYARLLNLNAEQQNRLSEAGQRHAQRCETFDSTLRTEAAAAAEPLVFGGGGFTAESVQRFDDAQAAAIRAMHALDEQYFLDIQTTLSLAADDPGLLRVRQARQRQWWSMGMQGGLRANGRTIGGAMESLLDLATILRRMPGVHAQDPAIDRILAEYESAIATPLKSRYDLVHGTQQAENQSYVAYGELARQKEGNVTREDVEALNRRLGLDRLQSAARAVNQQIREINSATIEQVVAALPEETGRKLRREYERLCWPLILNDPAEVGEQLTSALRLADLTEHQRGEIEELAATYRSTYGDLCQQMIDSVERPDSTVYGWIQTTEDDSRAFTERESNRKRLAFDRYELNVRAWQELRRILSEQQASRIGLRRTPPPPPNEEIGSFGV